MPFHQPNLVCGCGNVHVFDVPQGPNNDFDCVCGVHYNINIAVPPALLEKLMKGEPTTQGRPDAEIKP